MPFAGAARPQDEERNGGRASADQPQLFISLFYVARVVARRSRLVLLVTSAAAVATLVFALLLPDIYTAKTMIVPTQEERGGAAGILGQLGAVAGLTGGALTGAAVTDLYVGMLKSEAVKDPVIDRFSLMKVYDEKYRADAYKTLDQNATIFAGKKDGIITITVDDKDPRRAAQMADGYVEELGKLAVKLNVTGAGQTRSFMAERLAKAKVDLAKAEEQLKTFQSQNKIVQVAAQATATIDGIAEMKAKLAAEEVKLATCRRQFTESTQEVKNQVASVSNLRAQIARLEGNGGNSAIPAVGSVPAIGQEYARLMRELKARENLVESLTRQFEVASVSEAKDFPPFQVLLKAKVPEKKSKPSRSAILVTVTLLAFLVSSFLAFMLEHVRKVAKATNDKLDRSAGGHP